MAYSFSASTDKITFAAPSFGAASMSIALWFKTSSAVQYAQLIGNENPGGFTLMINHDSATGGQLAMYLLGGLILKDTSVDWSDNSWHQCVVTRSGSAFTAYVDGVQRATGTSGSSADGAVNMVVGRNDAYPPRNMIGDVAEIGIWTGIALNASEVNALYKGFTCDQIRPQNLVRYLPLVRGTTELARGTTVTASGGAVAVHPRIFT